MYKFRLSSPVGSQSTNKPSESPFQCALILPHHLILLSRSQASLELAAAGSRLT